MAKRRKRLIEKAKVINFPSYSRIILQNNPLPNAITEFDRKKSQSSLKPTPTLDQLNFLRASKRRKQNIEYLINMENFEYFGTLTFAPIHASKSLRELTPKIKKFTKILGTLNVEYLLVFEKHQSGYIHVHGAFSKNLPQSLNDYGYGICDVWLYGFSNIQAIHDSERTAKYLAKYLTKSAVREYKGQRLLWTSRNVNRPTIEYPQNLDKVLDGAEFVWQNDNITILKRRN